MWRVHVTYPKVTAYFVSLLPHEEAAYAYGQANSTMDIVCYTMRLSQVHIFQSALDLLARHNLLRPVELRIFLLIQD